MAKNTIVEQLKKDIAYFQPKGNQKTEGVVMEVFDGIVNASGLSTIKASEMVEFANGELGVAMNLLEGSVGIIVLGSMRGIREGDKVTATGKILEIPVGDELIGRTIDALGQSIDGAGDITPPTGGKKSYPIERIAPGVITRKSVDQPVQTDINPDQLKNATLILIDDVQNSGRTLAYALRHFLQYPVHAVQTCVLIDRRHNFFPVKADYIGLSLSTTLQEHVQVEVNGTEVTVLLQ